MDALLKSEQRICLLEKSRGSLIDLERSKLFVSQILAPILIWLRKLSDAGRNPEEKALLQSLCETGLAVIRTSAADAANFNGKNVS